MKNDILADIPAAISLAPLGSYIPYPSGRANSLPTWNYWWFFKSVKQASRPQSAQGFPLPLWPPIFLPLEGSRRISVPQMFPLSLPLSGLAFELRKAGGTRLHPTLLLLLLLSTLLFIFQTFPPLFSPLPAPLFYTIELILGGRTTFLSEQRSDSRISGSVFGLLFIAREVEILIDISERW